MITLTQQHSRKMLTRDQNFKIGLCKICYPPGKFFWAKWILTPKICIFTVGIFEILRSKVSRSCLWILAITKMAKNWHFCNLFNFYPILDYYKIKPKTNVENPDGKSLDLHLMMWFIRKKLFLGSTVFTVAIFKIPQISKHFSAMLYTTDLLAQLEKNFVSIRNHKISP